MTLALFFFHPRAQRNAFRGRNARQQSRSFALWNQSHGIFSTCYVQRSETSLIAFGKLGEINQRSSLTTTGGCRRIRPDTSVETRVGEADVPDEKIILCSCDVVSHAGRG